MLDGMVNQIHQIQSNTKISHRCDIGCEYSLDGALSNPELDPTDEHSNILVWQGESAPTVPYGTVEYRINILISSCHPLSRLEFGRAFDF
jgi:hypothetical protein